MVAEHVVDRPVQGIDQEFEIRGRDIAAADDEVHVIHPVAERGGVDALVNFIGDGEHPHGSRAGRRFEGRGEPGPCEHVPGRGLSGRWSNDVAGRIYTPVPGGCQAAVQHAGEMIHQVPAPGCAMPSASITISEIEQLSTPARRPGQMSSGSPCAAGGDPGQRSAVAHRHHHIVGAHVPGHDLVDRRRSPDRRIAGRFRHLPSPSMTSRSGLAMISARSGLARAIGPQAGRRPSRH